jgi:hypothetical protein
MMFTSGFAYSIPEPSSYSAYQTNKTKLSIDVSNNSYRRIEPVRTPDYKHLGQLPFNNTIKYRVKLNY